MRTLSVIAQDIRLDWTTPYFGAVPYIEAMEMLTSLNDAYGADSADGIVRYFLANASSWRGPKAREIKAELKEGLKAYR